MLGIRFIKSQPTMHLMQFRRGQVVREGAGLSFFYYGPTSTLVAVPVGSQDRPFILELVTSDFQSITVQGQVTSAATGSAISGARVSLSGTSFSATTSTDGTYAISGVPYPVTYDITASARRYKKATVRVQIAASPTTQNFGLNSRSAASLPN